METLTRSFCLSGFTSSTVPEKFANAPSMTRISSPASKLTRGLGFTAPSTMLLRRSSICGGVTSCGRWLPMKPVTLGVSLTRCQTSSVIVHLDEDVSGEAGLLARARLAARALLGHRLGRDEDLAEAVLHVVLLDALEERFFDLGLVARVGLDDVPLLGHDDSAAPVHEIGDETPRTCPSARRTPSRRLVVTITTNVPLVTSVRVGQVTLAISAATSSAS